MYTLARTLGASVFGAIAGALVFQLGNTSLVMANWSPMHGGTFAWFPWALYACERLLAAPDRRRSLLLGAVLTLALLPGFPLMPAFMYLLIALRVGWEIVLRRTARPGAVLLAIAVALALPPLLGAVQLLPAVEFARLSIRGIPLPGADTPLRLSDIQYALAFRSAGVIPLMLVGWMLAAASPLRRETRSTALFYLFAAAFLFALAFGVGSGVYADLVVGSLVHWPVRFCWATDVCGAAAAALGVDALAGLSGRGRGVAVAAVVLPGAVLLVFDRLTPGGLPWRDWAVAAPVLVVTLVAVVVPRSRVVVGPALAAIVFLNTVVAPFGQMQRLLPSDAPLFAHEGLFATLRSRLTANDRVLLMNQPAVATTFGLMDKSATLFQTPSLTDYEPQLNRRWADYLLSLRYGAPMTDPHQVMFSTLWNAGITSRRLLDLAAGRYLVVDPKVDTTARWLTPPPPRLDVDDDTLRVYENAGALPRARFVPRVEVVADAMALLHRLTSGDDDPSQVALVETPPASGTLGERGDAGGARVTFVQDDPEHIVLRVDAPRAGFVLLADQYYPGWQATVNGRPTPVERADYVFRLVAVPAGTSTVEFRFRPASVLVGGLVSLATLAAVGLWLRRPATRGGPAAADAVATRASV
jgi:hypothetical protein